MRSRSKPYDQDIVTTRFYSDLGDARARRSNGTQPSENGLYTMLMGGTMLGVTVVILLLIKQNIHTILGWLA